MKRILRLLTKPLLDYGATFSFFGLAVATCFFAGSLSPSLLPRNFVTQGLLSGFALAIGYGLGVTLVWLWRYLELPTPGRNLERWARWATAVVVGIVALGFLWRATIWQNSIRERMAMESVATAYPFRVLGIAILMGIIVLAAARLIGVIWRFVDRQIRCVLPRRVATVLSVVVVATCLIALANRFVIRTALQAADEAFLQLDQLIDEGIRRPELATATGSSESLIGWQTVGRQGRSFVVSGPNADQLREFLGRPAKQPLRVYVGLGTRDTMRERAELAVEELKRVGGFERSILIVATPTGTGWLDPSAVDSVEYLHGGDTAIVSMQYSYLPSWITILVDPIRSRESARILFEAVYDHWRSLPRVGRPKLYLHGLSLGSLGSESSSDLFTIFEDPIQGGVFSGPPFPSEQWNRIVAGRTPDSLMWMPRFRDGSMVRFTNQENQLYLDGARWGPMRFVYVQYASDPMVFFSPDMLFREPAWMIGQRGPDVSPFLRWYPILTFMQILFDLPMATSVPIGYGHNYAPAHYIDAWQAVTEPSGWDAQQVDRLKQELTRQRETE
jgi:uncharacterized membrane protein